MSLHFKGMFVKIIKNKEKMLDANWVGVKKECHYAQNKQTI